MRQMQIQSVTPVLTELHWAPLLKKKNQTDFKTATALCHAGRYLLELCPPVSSEVGLAAIPNILTADL